MSFFKRDNSACSVISFTSCPCLVNRQYKHMSLSEMIHMYHQTGQFPAVGMHNGVYTGDAIVPVDKFDIIDMQNGFISQIESKEKELAELQRKKRDEDIEQQRKELADLKQRLASYAAKPSPDVSDEAS